jgi:hypothetical protein
MTSSWVPAVLLASVIGGATLLIGQAVLLAAHRTDETEKPWRNFNKVFFVIAAVIILLAMGLRVPKFAAIVSAIANAIGSYAHT